MCGHCSKINETDLKMVEKEMNTIIIQIASEVNEKNSTYFQTLQLLRGTYSYKYNCFERYCMKKFRDVKDIKKEKYYEN